MREDCLEALERAYPNGFLILYLDEGGGVKLTGVKIDAHPWLIAAYHQAIASAALMGTNIPIDPSTDGGRGDGDSL